MKYIQLQVNLNTYFYNYIKLFSCTVERPAKNGAPFNTKLQEEIRANQPTQDKANMTIERKAGNRVKETIQYPLIELDGAGNETEAGSGETTQHSTQILQSQIIYKYNKQNRLISTFSTGGEETLY